MRVLTKKRVINLMMINRRQNLSQNIFRDQLLFLKITNIYVEYKQKKGYVGLVQKTTKFPVKDYWSAVAVAHPCLFIPDMGADGVPV